ncbi:MAG: nicotinate-nucleotide adenylyltransferase [Aridibacter sp.]
MKRIAFYGGSFDPVHNGHLAIAENLTEFFELDEFVLIPAFHAPHKSRLQPTSADHRFAMLCLATDRRSQVKVSTIELEVPEKPYTIETLTKLKNDLPETEIFFVMGADSWAEITTWREWEKVLTIVNIIVVTRPNYDIEFLHVTDGIRDRILDLRDEKNELRITNYELRNGIFITDAVQMDISATRIRAMIRANEDGWKECVDKEVAKHIEKYDLYEVFSD